ncbi:MAG TPA: hypothetical protein VGE42_02620 [Candidatus Dormibacteraeota bacterium]
MESIPTDLPPLPRRRITLPLSTLAEVAREVCDGYDPPGRGCAYAKAHPLWRELPAHLHALMNALVCVCRGRAGELTLTRCTSLGRLIGRSARTVRRQLAQVAEHGLIVTGQTRGGVRWVALTRAAVLRSRWRPPEPLRLHLAARACRTPAAVAKLARAEAYLRDALLAEATVTGRAPPLEVADTRVRLLA